MRTDWTDGDLALLRKSIGGGVRPYLIARMFPDRSIKSVYCKIFYEKNYAFDRDVRLIASAAEDAADRYEATANTSNQMQDSRFQGALQAAIDAGLETLPKPMPMHDEFRPAFFDRTAGISFGASPAQLCAELGAR